MLKSAQLYEGQLKKKVLECWYDERYKYYDCQPGNLKVDIPDNNVYTHIFVSVDEEDNIVGLINYSLDWVTMTAYQLGIIGFADNFKNRLLFAKDIIKAIDDIFIKYNLNRLSWYVVEDNPVIKSYRKYIEKVGGKECGRFRQNVKLQDGKMHNEVSFEILKEEYRGWDSK